MKKLNTSLCSTGNEAAMLLGEDVLDHLYHGTAIPFDRFRDPAVEQECRLGNGIRQFGPAIYLTTDANGFGRYYARSSVLPKSMQLLRQDEGALAEKVGNGWGVVLTIEVSPKARILRIEHAPEVFQRKFLGCKTDYFSKVLGRDFRADVLAAGYDGISYKSNVFPEGWEADTASHEVVLYRHEMANIVHCHDAESYRLTSGWSERGERGLAVTTPATPATRPQEAWSKVDEAFDALNMLLDASGSLESVSIQRAMYQIRLEIVRGLQDQDRIKAAEACLNELSHGDGEKTEIDDAAPTVAAERLASIQGKAADADLRERVLDLVYTRAGIETIEGCKYVVARHRSTNVAIVVVDGNFSRSIFLEAMEEVRAKQLRMGRMYVYAQTATYSGRGICFCKFEEIGI